jgi:hypothetical protein
MQIDIRKSIMTGRLVAKRQCLIASLDQISDDYLIMVPIAFLVAIPAVALFTLIKDGAPIGHVLIALFLLIALLCGFYYTLQAIKQNCLLTWIETGLDKQANRELSLRAIESIGWKLVENYKSNLAAITGIAGFTWGQEVTVIFDDGGVYVNCKNRSGGPCFIEKSMAFW